MSHGRIAFREDNRWGFVDGSGNVIVMPIYYLHVDFHEGFAFVAIDGYQIGFIDLYGNPITDFYYEFVMAFYNGLAGVRVNDQWGFIDSTGSVIIPIEYDWVGFFRGGLAPVIRCIDEQIAVFIDKSGAEVISTLFISDDVVFENYKDVEILSWIPSGVGFDEGFSYVAVRFLVTYHDGLVYRTKEISRLCFINASGEIVLATDFDYRYAGFYARDDGTYFGFAIEAIIFSEGLLHVRFPYGHYPPSGFIKNPLNYTEPS